jgi:putative SOS response-associated peptidase YedK
MTPATHPMCVNYVTVSRLLAFEYFRTQIEVDEDWRDELYQDYSGPIIVHDDAGDRKGLVGSYGFIPKRRMPPGQRLTTMNARAETVGQLRSYKSAWSRSQLCLVPMRHFYEPNWEQEKHVRWSIGMASGEPFAVAGLYRQWEEEDGTNSYSFTQLTINANEHPLMKRFHRPGDEKRSLVIVPVSDYDDWLGCKDPERARTYLQPYPAELMAGEPAPKGAAFKQTALF